MTAKKRTTYVLVFADGETQEFARKDTAIRAGEKSGDQFIVETSSGKTVYESLPEEPETAEEAPEATPAPEPEEPQREAPSSSSKPVDIEKQKEKIRMLLAKAESTTFEAERDTFNAAAEKLMLRLGLDIAELEAGGRVAEEEEIIEVRRTYPGNYSIVMVPFAADVAHGFGNVTVLARNVTGSLTRQVYLIGFRSDVEMVTQLLDSLDLQVMSALRVWQKENIEWRRGLTDMERYIGHRSFITGFGGRVRTRLEEERKEVFSEASHGAELVLASRDDKVKDWVAANIPTVKGRGGSRKFDLQAMSAGAAAGEKANLGNRSLSSKD